MALYYERINCRKEFVDICVWIQLVNCLAVVYPQHFPVQSFGIGDGSQKSGMICTCGLVEQIIHSLVVAVRIVLVQNLH